MGDVEAKLDALLGTLDLDEGVEMNAAIARALAAKLDMAQASSSGAAAIAAPALAKELRAVIDEIRSAADDRDGFVTDLFS